MKNSVRCLWTAFSGAVLGILGALIRSRYFEAALDERGFLVPGHALQYVFWILAVAVGIFCGIMAFQKGTSPAKAPRGLLAGIGDLLLAGGLGLTVLHMSSDLSFYGILRILGLAAAALLLVNGLLLLGKKNLGVLPHGLLCIFLILYLVGMYSRWSNVPEMERILVPAVALVLMLPMSCEMAAWDIDQGKTPRLLFLAGMTAFFSFSALGCPGGELLHVGSGLWALSAVLNLRREGENG